jgi:hypothetical protein
VQRKPPDKTGSKPPKPGKHPAQLARERVKKAAINALKKAERIAARTGVKLSDWEDEFLGSVADRIKTYGRAFGDADKGDLSAPLSMMQGRKLKEITSKAKGEAKPFKPRKGFRKKAPGGAGER